MPTQNPKQVHKEFYAALHNSPLSWLEDATFSSQVPPILRNSIHLVGRSVHLHFRSIFSFSVPEEPPSQISKHGVNFLVIAFRIKYTLTLPIKSPRSGLASCSLTSCSPDHTPVPLCAQGHTIVFSVPAPQSSLHLEHPLSSHFNSSLSVQSQGTLILWVSPVLFSPGMAPFSI